MIFDPPTSRPDALREAPLTLAAAECQLGLRATLPALTNHLQEAAGLHAHALGVGIETLQQTGFTWMLSRLALRLHRLPCWREALTLSTWPSGTRGRLAAERQFVLESASGERLLEASSEWLYVDFVHTQLARLPATVAALAHPGTLNFGLCAGKLPALPEGATPLATRPFAVRRSEIDANGHVNNVHYTEWMFETVPEALYFQGTPERLDIEYRQAARLGEEVLVRTWALAATRFLHTVSRADGQLLARALTQWRA